MFTVISFKAYIKNQAPVAQLDRVIGFEPIGREFESLRAGRAIIKYKWFVLSVAQQGKESSILRLKKRFFDRAFKNAEKMFSGTWQKSRGFSSLKETRSLCVCSS